MVIFPTYDLSNVASTLFHSENVYQMFLVRTTPEKFESGVFTLETYQMFSVHTTPEKFRNGVFTLKAYQMFSVRTTPEEFKTKQSLVILNSCLRKTQAGISRDYRDVIVFEKLRFPNVLRPHENVQPTFSKFLGFQKRFRKAPFP